MVRIPTLKRGLRRLAMRWPWPVKAALKDGGKMWVDLRSPIGQANLVKGEFDIGVWHAIAEDLPSGGVFLDVGANVGFYSMLASARVGEFGQVHSFEIDPRPLRCLRRNRYLAPWRNLHVHEFAVGKGSGSGILRMAEDCGHSSVSQSGRGKVVPLRALDEWVEQVGLDQLDVMKIDVEGGEMNVLEGARKSIERFKPIIVCEVSEAGTNGIAPEEGVLERYFEEMKYAVRFAANVHSPTMVATPISSECRAKLEDSN